MLVDSPPSGGFALAILIVNGRYLLQLRADRPDIVAPGQWGLFGGHVEAGETPDAAIAREVGEELGIVPDGWRPLWRVDDPAYGAQWFFEADFTLCWGRHVLRDGQDARCFPFDATPVLTMPAIIRAVLVRHHGETARDGR